MRIWRYYLCRSFKVKYDHKLDVRQLYSCMHKSTVIHGCNFYGLAQVGNVSRLVAVDTDTFLSGQ